VFKKKMGISKGRGLVLAQQFDSWDMETSRLFDGAGGISPSSRRRLSAARKASSTTASSTPSSTRLSTAASSSRPSTPSRPSSSALTTLGHRFSDETDSAGSSSSSSSSEQQCSSGSSEGLDGRIPHFQEQSEPSQGSSEQEYDSDLEDLESRCLDEQSLSKKLEDLEERKRTIDQKYNDALSQLSTTHPTPHSPPSHTFTASITCDAIIQEA
jgi:hypothetical protein